MKERVEVYQDLGSEGGSARGVVDLESGLIAHDERIGRQGFGTVGTPLRETSNSHPQAVFVVQDEHDGLPLSSLAPAPVAGDLRVKYTHLARRLDPLRGSVLSQRASATMCIPGRE
ncbi:MAG: hypothetical protein ACJ788_16670 [Ktedonobacteraceae bacterium]